MMKDVGNESEEPHTSTIVNRSNAIAIQATQWSELQDIDKVQGFSDTDAPCIRELYGVLKKCNQLERFGIDLLHKHFEVADDEFLLETTDVEQRTQLIRPVKKCDYAGRKGMSRMATIVKLAEADGRI